MKRKSVSGKISTKLIKLAKNEILKPLTLCINFCIENDTFSSEMKQTDITPIFKKGDPKMKSNYRPISLLPLLSKIFEKIVQFQLSSYFELKLSKKLCGFREKTFYTTHNFPTHQKSSRLVRRWQICWNGTNGSFKSV